MVVTTPSIFDLHASATTTDGMVSAEISGRWDVRVMFAPGYYEVASAEELAWQLERLAPELFRERMRSYYRIRSEQEGRPVMPPAPRPERAEYDAARAEVLAVGESHGGAIRMTALAMETWSVTVAPEARTGLDEHAFAVAAGRAASALVRSQYQQVAGLKRQFFGSR